MAAAKKKAAKGVAPKKAAPKASKAPTKVAPKKQAPPPKVAPQKQMTGKARQSVKGDNGGPADLDFDTGQEAVRRSPAQLAELREKGIELVDLQAKADNLGQLLKEMNTQISEIEGKELPKMMGDLQMTSFGLENGFEIELKDKLIGTLPKEPAAREKAFEIIEEREGGDIIKSFVTIAFAKSEKEQAEGLVEELKERGLPAEMEVSVHHQTLLAWAKEHIEDEGNDDDPLPLAELGLSFIHYARVKAPKAPKAKKS